MYLSLFENGTTSSSSETGMSTYELPHCKNIGSLDAIWNFLSFMLFNLWVMWFAYTKIQSTYESRMRTHNRFINFPEKMLFLLYLWITYSAVSAFSAWLAWFTGGGWNAVTIAPLTFYLLTVIGHCLWTIILFYKRTCILSFLVRIVLFGFSTIVLTMYAHIFAPIIVSYIIVLSIDAYELLYNGIIVYQKFMSEGWQSVRAEIVSRGSEQSSSGDANGVVTHRKRSSSSTSQDDDEIQPV